MEENELKEICLSILNKTNKPSQTKFIKENKQNILEISKWKSISETLWNWKNPNYENKCLECGNKTKFISISDGYRKTCSKKCGYKQATLNREKTNKKRYGVKHCLQSKELKEKFVETSLEKYGVSHPWKNSEIRNKRNVTMLERYGSFSTTSKDHQGRHIKNKEDMNEVFILENFIDDNGYFNRNDFCNYFNVSFSFFHKNIRSELNIPPCKKLFSGGEKEVYDYVLSLNKKTLVNDRSIINPLELDIVVPEHKIAIEFNGMMFHSYGKDKNWPVLDNYFDLDRFYHLNKTIKTEKSGYQLLHISEYEWNNKKDIWKSMISNKLGVCDRKIPARKTEIVYISDSKTIKEFYESNHLQGYCSGIKNSYGLLYNGELVYCISVGKSRFNGKYDIELLRACTKKYTLVVGGFSKLLKVIKGENNQEIITFANRNYSNGDLYSKLGKYIGFSNPNYVYYDPKLKTILKRQTCQKHKLSKLLVSFDDTKTEIENMIDNGYRIMFDSGNLKYIL